MLREAHRMLLPNGLLCLSGLSAGVARASRTAERVVSWVQPVRPSLVGGCRPVDLLPFLGASESRVQYHTRVVAFGIPSQVVVAKRC